MPVSGKTYNIVNEGSGLLLDVSGKDTKDGADVIQWTSNGQTNQQWTLANLGNGSWTIRPVHSNKALDLYGWSNGNNAPIKQWSYSGNGNQQWTLSKTSTGGFKIASTYSKLLATVDGSAATKLYQSPDATSSAYQRWYFNPVDGKCDSGNTGTGKSFMGSNKILIGSINTGTAQKYPFDVQYQYINNVAPVEACMTSCKAATSCGSWWGCWQWNELPPGTQYPVGFVENLGKLTWQNQPHPQMTFWTYYSLRNLAGGAEGKAELNVMNDSTALKRYFADYRFFLKKIGNARAMVDIEPDLWGFVKGFGDPHKIPAQVTAANQSDCAWEENSAAGLAHCLVSMARKYAPNLGVGMHASCFDYQTKPQECVDFLKIMTRDADFMVGDVSDRDAGWYEKQAGQRQDWRWWDGTKGADALAFFKLITEGTGKPLVLWQIPVGNMRQNNTKDHYQDDKVDYLFSHLNELADAHVAALLFGPGWGEQTSIDTDGNNLINKTLNYWNTGGQQLR